jgi:alpha-ketoglutarate-dependent taurine dioxygenase
VRGVAPQIDVAPRCWTAAQMRAITSWHFSVDDGVRREIDALVDWSRLPSNARDPIALLREDSVATPNLARLATDVLREVRRGSGVALVKAHFMNEDAFRLAYVRIGLALGTPIETYGRLYEVRDTGASYRETAAPVSQTRESTGMHTDSSGKDVLPTIIGLGCVRQAPRGGSTRLVSAAQVHQSLRFNPPLLRRLYGDFVRDVVTPGSDRSPAQVAKNRFPVFSYDSGRLRFRYMRYWIERGHDRVGEPLDVEGRAALDALDAELSAPEHALSFRLSSREMLFLDNTLVAHDRDAYEDDPAAPRLMLRLWLAARELEDAFVACPECGAPWSLHWTYVWEGGEQKRRWNTCGLTRDQLETKWLDERTP